MNKKTKEKPISSYETKLIQAWMSQNIFPEFTLEASDSAALLVHNNNKFVIKAKCIYIVFSFVCNIDTFSSYIMRVENV